MDKLTVVDADTVCAVLQVSDRTLRTWIKDFGCPANKEGRTLTFSWPDVLAWYVGYANAKAGGVTGDFSPDDASEPADGEESLTQASLRKIKAEANLKELILAQKRGQVITIADARMILDRMFGTLKSQLLGSAPLLNTRLEGEPDSPSREAAIREFIENLCRELSTGKIVREAVAETNSDEDATNDAESETIDTLEAAGDDDVNTAVVDFLAADAALQELEAHAG